MNKSEATILLGLVWAGSHLPVVDHLVPPAAQVRNAVDDRILLILGAVRAAGRDGTINVEASTHLPAQREGGNRVLSEPSSTDTDAKDVFDLSDPYYDSGMRDNIVWWILKESGDTAEATNASSVEAVVASLDGVVSATIDIAPGERFDMVKRYQPFNSSGGYTTVGVPGAGVCHLSAMIAELAEDAGMTIDPYVDHLSAVGPMPGIADRTGDPAPAITIYHDGAGNPVGGQNLTFTNNSGKTLYITLGYEQSTRVASGSWKLE